MSSSIVFRLATIIEGEEDSTPYIADVLIENGLIFKIGDNLKVPVGVRTIEAKGYILCPGFIDMHAHSDLYLITHPEHEAKISQGCTVSPPSTFMALIKEVDGSSRSRWNILLPNSKHARAPGYPISNRRVEWQSLRP
jgi:predicted amidohydrolase YtcJ